MQPGIVVKILMIMPLPILRLSLNYTRFIQSISPLLSISHLMLNKNSIVLCCSPFCVCFCGIHIFFFILTSKFNYSLYFDNFPTYWFNLRPYVYVKTYNCLSIECHLYILHLAIWQVEITLFIGREEKLNLKQSIMLDR